MKNTEIKILTYDELVSIDFPPNNWIVDFLVPSDGITIVSALPGSYKTWLLLHLVICITTGQKVFGEFETTQSNVLMIDEENGARLIQGRLKSFGSFEDLNISFMFDNSFTVNKQSIDDLIEYCLTKEVKFITIDSLIRIHGANENDAAEMSKVFGHLKRVTAAGISILITHHNRKPGGNSVSGSQEMRGSSDILAALDCHIAIKRDGRKLKISQTKLRLCEEMKPIQVELTTNSVGEVGFEYSGAASNDFISRSDLLTKEVISQITGTSLNQSEIQRKLKEAGFSTSINTIRKLLEDKVSSGEFDIEHGARGSLMYTVSTSSANHNLKGG